MVPRGGGSFSSPLRGGSAGASRGTGGLLVVGPLKACRSQGRSRRRRCGASWRRRRSGRRGPVGVLGCWKWAPAGQPSSWAAQEDIARDLAYHLPRRAYRLEGLNP